MLRADWGSEESRRVDPENIGVRLPDLSLYGLGRL
jgi:hypothetical protein